MSTLQVLLLIGGVCHFGILIASALVPQVLDWKNVLAPLPTLVRRMFWVHGIFIVLTIIGFGGLTLLNSEALVGGSVMARSLCAFIAIFWGARLVLQFGVFDPTPYVEGRPILLIGHHGLTIVFAYLTAVYGWVAIAVEGNTVA